MENNVEILQKVTGNLDGDLESEILSQLTTDEEAKNEYNKVKNTWGLAHPQRDVEF